jgi:hypothetical protein
MPYNFSTSRLRPVGCIKVSAVIPHYRQTVSIRLSDIAALRASRFSKIAG